MTDKVQTARLPLSLLLEKAIICLNEPYHLGSFSHPLGSSTYSVETHLIEFHQIMEQVDLSLSTQAISKEAYEEEVSECLAKKIKNELNFLRLWCENSNSYIYEFINNTCPISCEYINDENDEESTYIVNKYLFIDFSRPSKSKDFTKELNVSAYVNDSSSASNPSITFYPEEVKELKLAIEKDDLIKTRLILKHMVTRGYSLLTLNPISQIEAVQNIIGFDGIEINNQCLLNYQVELASGKLKYVLQLKSPLAVTDVVSFRMTNQTFLLPELLKTMSIEKPSQVIRLGSSIGLYSVLGSNSTNKNESRSRGFLIQRLEHYQREVLEHQGVEFITCQTLFNTFLKSCYEQQELLKEQEDVKVEFLYTVQISCYPKGLCFKIQLNTSKEFNLYIDVLNSNLITIDDKEDEENVKFRNKEQREKCVETMMKILEKTKNVPAVIYFYIKISASLMNNNLQQDTSKRMRPE